MNTILGSLIIKFAVLVFLLIMTIFFVMSETSLTVLRKTQVKRLIREKGVKGLMAWRENPNRLLTTTLVGTAVCVVGVSVLGTSIALEISRVTDISATASTVASTAIIVAVVLVFSEIVPKAIARRNAQKVSALIINPLRVIDFLISPAVRFFMGISNLVIKAFGGKSLKDQPLFAFEEIKGLIEMGVKEGVLASAEKKMLSQIMEFGDTVAREIMVPSVNMKILNIEEEPSELIKKAINLRHSRIPVYKGSKDNITGVLYVKDILSVLVCDRKDRIKDIIRKPYFVPEEKKIGPLLKEFRQGREHLAVVVDEYGVASGLITIEDIVEEITGEIFDEYDIRKKRIMKIDRKTWDIFAIEDLDKINDTLNINLPEDEYDSLGGMIMAQLGHVPDEGEELKYKTYRIKVLQASPKRVIKARLTLDK